MFSLHGVQSFSFKKFWGLKMGLQTDWFRQKFASMMVFASALVLAFAFFAGGLGTSGSAHAYWYKTQRSNFPQTPGFSSGPRFPSSPGFSSSPSFPSTQGIPRTTIPTPGFSQRPSLSPPSMSPPSLPTRPIGLPPEVSRQLASPPAGAQRPEIVTYHCSNCDAQVTKNASRCHRCGIQLVGFTDGTDGISPQRSQQLAIGIFVLIFGGLMVFGVIAGLIALVIKVVAAQSKKKPKYVSNWSGGAGVSPSPVMNNTGNGMYQKEMKQRWGVAQVPKSISGAGEAGPANLGYAQGVRRPANRPPGYPTPPAPGQGGQPGYGQPPGPARQQPPGAPGAQANRPPGQPIVGRPAGYPGRPPVPPPGPSSGPGQPPYSR